MFSKKYKADNEHITPDEELLNSLTNKMKNYDPSKDKAKNIKDNHFSIHKLGYLRTSFACLLLFFVSFTTYNYLSNHGLLSNSEDCNIDTTTSDSTVSEDDGSTVLKDDGSSTTAEDSTETYDVTSSNGDDNSEKSSTTESNTSAKSSTAKSNTSAKSSSNKSDTSAKSSSNKSDTSAKSSSNKSDTSAKSSSNKSDTSAKSSASASDISVKSSAPKSDTSTKSSTSGSDTSAKSSTNESDTSVNSSWKDTLTSDLSDSKQQSNTDTTNTIDSDSAVLASLDSLTVKCIKVSAYPQAKQKTVTNSTDINLIVDTLKSIVLYEECPSAGDSDGGSIIYDLCLNDSTTIQFISFTPYININNTWYRANESTIETLSNLYEQLDYEAKPIP